MPSVPQYDQLQVQARALPGARQESVASSELFGIAAREQIRTGEALQRAGGGLAELAGKMQDRQNADMLFQRESVLKDELIQFDTEQRSKKGAAALADGGITKQANDWFVERVSKHSASLENDVQKKLFAQTADKLRLQTVDSFSKHQANEARTSVTESTNATIKSSIDRAAANSSDWTVMESERAEIDKRLAVLAQLNGYDGNTPEQKAIRDGKRGEMLTTMHKQVLQSLVKENPKGALAYFEKYKDDIDGSQRAEIGEFAKKATSTSVGDGTADAIWQADKPKSRTDPVTLDTMETKLRETLKGNDDAIKVGIAGLRERASAYRDQRKEESISLEAGVNSLIMKGMSTSQILRSPEYLKLSSQAPEEARKIDTFLENKDYMRGARADQAEARKERRLHRDTLTKTLQLSDPDALVGLKREEVVNLLPVLGTESTQALLNRWDSLTKNESKLREARIDKQDFDALALQSGLRPNESGKSEAEKNSLVQLQSAVENRIASDQASKKRDLTRDEKKVIMQQELDNSVMVDRFFTDKKVSAAMLTPREQEVSYVEIGPAKQRVDLVAIPHKFRSDAMAKRKASGLHTSEAQLAELWLRSKNQYKEK